MVTAVQSPARQGRARSWGILHPHLVLQRQTCRINPSEAACHPPRRCFAAPELKQGLEVTQPQEQRGLDQGAEQERIQVVFCKMAAPLNPRALYTT